MFYFNPRSRVGNDILSIKFARTTLTFQSTFPRGERRKTIDNVKAEEKFQSTFPRGERQGVSLTALISGNFNPRSRVGNDSKTNELYLYLDISIHVPAWGTTDIKSGISSLTDISIHVPAWGTTAKTYKFSIFIYTFLYKLVFFAI